MQAILKDQHSAAKSHFTIGIAKTKMCRVTDLGLRRRDHTYTKHTSVDISAPL